MKSKTVVISKATARLPPTIVLHLLFSRLSPNCFPKLFTVVDKHTLKHFHQPTLGVPLSLKQPIEPSVGEVSDVIVLSRVDVCWNCEVRVRY